MRHPGERRRVDSALASAVAARAVLSAIEPLSVVIPAYNEEHRLGPTLDRMTAWLSAHLRQYEIVVVDDGSGDATVSVARAREQFGVRVVLNDSNRGKGYSVRHGVAEARGRWVLMSDADLSTPIEELVHLAAKAPAFQVVIGSRAAPGARLVRRQPWYREAMGRTFNLLVQALLLPGIRDTQCGFKLFEARAARDVFSRVHTDGFGFDVEVLHVAHKLGYRIAEVPVRWLDDPATRVRPVRDALSMAVDLWRVRTRHAHLTPAGRRGADSDREERSADSGALDDGRPS